MVDQKKKKKVQKRRIFFPDKVLWVGLGVGVYSRLLGLGFSARRVLGSF